MTRPSRTALLFGIVVAICVAEVGWWLVFQLREARRLEVAGALLESGDTMGALRELGATTDRNLNEVARGRRLMFATEGAALGVLVLLGVVVFYGLLQRERRLRRNQERFLTGATHELKTPLTTLRLGLESLAAGTLPEEKRERYLQNMLGEADRLHRGLTNLLTAAGLESSRDYRARDGDFGDDVRASVEEIRPRAMTAGIAIAVGELAPCPVSRDEQALRLALHNLLDNAVKYSERGDTVSVALRRETDRGVLEVSDTGRGIEAEHLPHVFERFYRCENGDHLGGTGLGLHIVKSIIGDHGGRVSAHSTGRGRGCTFTLELPLRREAR